jgi:hypothetical protein
MPSAFMNLELPTVSVTLGPEWASALNEALELVDSHDHSSGKGTKVTPAGIEINADLSLEEYRLTLAKSVQFDDQSATLTGASHASSVYSKSGNLYYTNGSGVAVQITDGSAIITAPASTDNFEYEAFANSPTIADSDTVVVLGMDTTAVRTVTLPSVSAVTPGRLYVIVDVDGLSETNTLTVAADGSDTILGASSLAINSNYSATFLVGDGVSKWLII